MGAGKAIVKIFGMFDKVDDIVYEPIKLVCDVLRQPLVQIENNNEKRKLEQQQELEKQLKEFEVNLELDKKEREMKLDVESRRLNEEINQMILDNELARREDMIQMEMKYREEMANAAARLGQIMANIQVETRSKIIALYTEKEKEYLDLQDKYKKDMFNTVKQLRELFPDGTGEDIIRNEVTTQLKLIADRSTNFSNSMNADMERVFVQITTQTNEMSNIAVKYLNVEGGDKPALTQSVVDGINIKKQ